MNDLNSIIFEGTVTKVFALVDERFTCVLKSHNITGDTELQVKAVGKLATICFEKIEIKTRLRVVGALKKNEFDFYLNAEHVEFAPKRNY